MVQSYFDYFKTSEQDRLRLVGLLFEHRTSNWLLHQHDNNLVTTWPEFLEAVIQRFDPPPALKVTGTISGVYVQTIISGSSTHNFIQPDTVKKFRMLVMPTNPFRVSVGNESTFLCKEKCYYAKLSLGGDEFVVDLFVLPFRGPEVVLGVPWLKSLGEIYRSYDDQAMEFTHKDKLVTLRGVWEKGQHIFYNAMKE
ncbi:uncharacterized protein LOC125199797 [Salvia hispanica]|uniref:uncharacterized protein LOC125199797 n=1 Tax=Salvia hispanica TaxID=49212 RepID=UPI002009B710|nr:uncharacterized protein LOC125199797 [Salvia hispanica]